MNRLIFTVLLFFVVSCDKQSDASGNVTFLPNKDITFDNSRVYSQQTPFTGTLRGYNIDNNPECPDEITVDFVDGRIQGRAQAITLEDIDVLYQINDGKLNGWSVVLVSRILYQNDKPVECKLSKLGMELGSDLDCSRFLADDPASSSMITTGSSVNNTFYDLLNQINQHQFTRNDINNRCWEVYTYGQKALQE